MAVVQDGSTGEGPPAPPRRPRAPPPPPRPHAARRRPLRPPPTRPRGCRLRGCKVIPPHPFLVYMESPYANGDAEWQCATPPPPPPPPPPPTTCTGARVEQRHEPAGARRQPGATASWSGGPSSGGSRRIGHGPSGQGGWEPRGAGARAAPPPAPGRLESKAPPPSMSSCSAVSSQAYGRAGTLGFGRTVAPHRRSPTVYRFLPRGWVPPLLAWQWERARVEGAHLRHLPEALTLRRARGPLPGPATAVLGGRAPWVASHTKEP
jgi:hypothetical protein